MSLASKRKVRKLSGLHQGVVDGNTQEGENPIDETLCEGLQGIHQQSKVCQELKDVHLPHGVPEVLHHEEPVQND